MKRCFIDFKPDMVIYNAGTDCMHGDPLGRLNISPNGIILRDQVVFQECFVAKVPVGRLGEAEEVARCVVFLADEKAGFITGETISVNGGLEMD